MTTRMRTLLHAALVLGAAVGTAVAQQPGASPAAGAARRADPAAVSRELESYFAGEAAAGRFSGAVAVGREGSPVFQGAWGMADREKKLANDVDTKFNLGSMNKMFTAVAIAQLVSEGRLRFDDPLSKFYPDFPTPQDAGKIRVEHLLTHTSGLGSYFNPRYMRERPQTIQGVVDVARDNARMAFEPGKGWNYSNTGFLLLGGIIEKVTGKSYFDYVRERIFEPAGMRSTSSPAFGEAVPNLALAYAAPGTLGPDTTVRPLYRGTSAGGGVSTLGDLLRFSDALLRGRLLPPEYVRLLTTAKPETGSSGYGYGFGVDRGRGGLSITGHNGGAPGTFANLDIYPEQGYATVLLQNNADGEVQEGYVERLRGAMESILGVAGGPGASAGASPRRAPGGQPPAGGRPPAAAVFEALVDAVAAGDEAAVRRFVERHMTPGLLERVPMAEHLAQFQRMTQHLGRAEILELARVSPSERRARLRSSVDGRIYVLRLHLTGDSPPKIDRIGWGPEEQGGEPAR